MKISSSDALLAIDIQNDFCPDGALAAPNGDKVVAPANRMFDKFLTVVLSQDWHPKRHSSFASSHEKHNVFEQIEMPYGPQVLWPDHCIQGTRGAEFHKDLQTEKAHLVIRKGCNPEVDSYSAFFENDKQTSTGLGGYLRQRGILRVFLLGLVAEYCVGFSALDGLKEGFEALVFEDAVDTLGGEYFDEMHKTQIDAGVKFLSTADIV